MKTLDRQIERAREHVDPKWDDEHVALLLVRSKDRQRRRRRGRIIGVVVAASAVATIGLMMFEHDPPKLAPRNPRPMVQTEPPPPPVAHEPLRFTDGSRATALVPDTELVMQTVTAREVTLALLRGAAAFEVVPNPRRTFVVDAGPVRVEVIGTLFSVERLDTKSIVAVERGRVRVMWDGGSKVLGAGEHGTFPAVDARPKPRFVLPPQPAVPMKTDVAKDVVGALLESADTARMADRPVDAFRHLRTVVTEHPDDTRTPAAAFTAARIAHHQLDRPAEAAEMYRAARELEPAGSLAEDAWLREVEARIESGDVDTARRLADRYRQTHPSGRHLRRIEDAASSALK